MCHIGRLTFPWNHVHIEKKLSRGTPKWVVALIYWLHGPAAGSELTNDGILLKIKKDETEITFVPNFFLQVSIVSLLHWLKPITGKQSLQ